MGYKSAKSARFLYVLCFPYLRGKRLYYNRNRPIVKKKDQKNAPIGAFLLFLYQ